jgi:putative aminopeptidase FrvX
MSESQEPSPIATTPLETVDLLKKLIAAPGPSGYEQPVQEVFRAGVVDYADKIETDLLGNTYAILNPSGSVKVMLAGHCDEIGFLVTHIHDKGYLYFSNIGGHDANITVGQRVLVHTARHGSLPGVIGKKPVHLMDDDERGRKTKLDDLFIDIGVRGKDTAVEKVSMGDPVTYAAPFEMLEGDLAVAHAFDNKSGTFIVAEAIRLLATDRRELLSAAVYGVSTVQEEIGLRGAKTSAYFTQATVGIALDVGHAADYPGIDKRKTGDIEIGKGPVITRGANINPQVYKMLIEAANEEGIPYQLNAKGAGTGTDANAMQLNQAGMAVGLVELPLRYMHTPCEVVSLTDVQNCARLVAAFVRKVTPETDFRPSMENYAAPVQPKAKDSGEPSSE